MQRVYSIHTARRSSWAKERKSESKMEAGQSGSGIAQCAHNAIVTQFQSGPI
jgi:hypothetical protein